MNSGFYALMIAAAALWGGREALAVNPGEVSQSAEAVCVFRAIAAQHPDPKLRNPDDLAGRLCASPANVPQSMGYFYVNARTHYIDAALERAAQAGMWRRGEPYISGWTLREAAAFAKRHGLQVVEDVGEKELTRRHLTGADGKPGGRMFNWTRLIEVKVP